MCWLNPSVSMKQRWTDKRGSIMNAATEMQRMEVLANNVHNKMLNKKEQRLGKEDMRGGWCNL